MSQPYTYWECPGCGWSCVTEGEAESWENAPAHVACPVCFGDNGRHVSLRGRPALETDIPEGVDERTAT